MINNPTWSKHALNTIIGVCFGIIILIGLYQPTKWSFAILICILFFMLGMIFLTHIENIIYALFIFFIPLQLGKSFFYIPYAGGGHDLRINLPEIFFLMLLVFWIIDLLRNKRIVNKIDYSLLISGSLFLLLSLLSLSSAKDVSTGIFELIRGVTAFLIFIYIAHYVDTEKKLKMTMGLLLCGAAVQIGIGLVQWIIERDLGLEFFGEMGLSPDSWAEESTIRVGGLLGHPNAFATYLTMTLPFCLFFLESLQRKTTRVASFVLLCSGCVVLLATKSRGAWLGFGISALCAFIFFIFRAKRVHIRRFGVITVVIISLLVGSIVSQDVIKKRLFIDDKGSAASRVPMMIDALEVIRNNPFMGIGLNNYSLVISKYDVTGIHKEWVAMPVHNLFLLIAAETGIMSLLVFMAFWAIILQKVYALSKINNKKTFILSIAFLISLTSFFIIHQVDPTYRFYPSIQREIWLIAGLVVSSNRIKFSD